MNLLEYQGKELFRAYGIAIPRGQQLFCASDEISFAPPYVLKAQVPISDRKKLGGIVMALTREECETEARKLLQKRLGGFLPESVLVEECIVSAREWYISVSYDGQGPVLAFSTKGGSGTVAARVFPVDPFVGPTKIAHGAFGLDDEKEKSLRALIGKIWKLFQEKNALLVEINPLFQLADGTLVAGDAKVALDDNAMAVSVRPFIELGGDIAVIASGGGASMLCLDMLLKEGGRPANYAEYSGNPPASVVEALAKRALSQPGLAGCWVVGGTANFTDLYETLSGFLAGLRAVNPKPAYPIVIRRDGPRREEAFALIGKAAREEGYNIRLCGPDVSMAESARLLLRAMT